MMLVKSKLCCTVFANIVWNLIRRSEMLFYVAVSALVPTLVSVGERLAMILLNALLVSFVYSVLRLRRL